MLGSLNARKEVPRAVRWNRPGDTRWNARLKGGRHDCQKLPAMQESSQEEDVATGLEVRRLRLGVRKSQASSARRDMSACNRFAGGNHA